ncbi:MAG: DNA/RNA non-specific endonuclease [Alphaproteobacteria bacterium]|nr:DNA/RNA non-specific endonuclease [Alphaproteobacteria bacterium]MBV8411139.1 DNA/RNA non-specific endonuclease [Alphaproteobacteria bacterium]
MPDEIRRLSESQLETRLARLRALNDLIHRSDPRLAEESRDRTPSLALESMSGPSSTVDQIGLESIILRRTRPVLAIRDNDTQLAFADAEDSAIWRDRLTKAKSFLDAAIRAVGRINLKGAPLDWVGTGWLVADNIIVTNRHVAAEFAARQGQGFDFKLGVAGKIDADIDFLQEVDSAKTLIFQLLRPLHIVDAPGADVAFFEVEPRGDAKLAQPIALASAPIETQNVATIGYPAYDSRIPEPDLMEQIFDRIYNKKRLAPGGVTRVEDTQLLHTCTTLGGNSGSAVVDLDSGQALGLHFSGSFLASNYAVRSDIVKRLLDDVRAGRSTSVAVAAPRPPAPRTPQREIGRPAARPPAQPALQDRRMASFAIPLTVTVTLGDGGTAMATPVATSPVARWIGGEGGDVVGEEGVVADYRDREGYVPAFLGKTKKFVVSLPEVMHDRDDMLEFKLDGKTGTELRYEHYSVVMCRSRRMCFFSAVNIDGGQSRKSARVAWKWDPRIPRTQQIMNECYGSPPKFSRGHMTRREDPGWGDARTAQRGNEDSMHVTNTTPQMQAFNSPIWLALEDYALDHARDDGMKVSVFTGPYFADDDPTLYGVRIPRAFWKIIAFVHDETGQLCATGYQISQEQSLPPAEEFVFGAFTSPQLNLATQVSIRSIERRSGIRFGNLGSVDPLAGTREGLGDAEARPPLLDLQAIQFLP